MYISRESERSLWGFSMGVGGNRKGKKVEMGEGWDPKAMRKGKRENWDGKTIQKIRT